MYKVANDASSAGQGYRLVSKTQTQAMGMFQNGTLRAPSGPQTTFASEQIIDMLAIAANMDPYTFRVQNMATARPARAASGRATPACSRPRSTRPRRTATSRTSPARSSRAATSSRGWGMAIGTHNDSYAATVAHVEVNKKTGKVTVLHLYAAQDSGFAINPGPAHEPDVRQPHPGRRASVLHEELQFDKKRVTSRDWVSYPILRFKDTPKVTTVLVQPAGSRRVGLGRAAAAFRSSAAIANAIYDATGVRMTQAPLTPARVRGFLAGAGK